MISSTKKIHMFVLTIMSVIFSRSMFFFFDDTEGTNLLVTTVMAVLVYGVTLALYFFKAIPVPLASPKRLLLVICLQITLVTGLYFCLK